MMEMPSSKFGPAISKLATKFGKPQKVRGMFVEWKLRYHNFDVEINLMDKRSALYRERMSTFLLLKKNMNLREKYRNLKKQYSGSSEKKYLLAKDDFFNDLIGL
jgi:hypothetical protein